MAGKTKTPLVDKLPTSTGKRRISEPSTVGLEDSKIGRWHGLLAISTRYRVDHVPLGQEDLSSSSLHRIRVYMPIVRISIIVQVG